MMVRIGNFLFRHRNWLFPLIMLGLYLIAPPPPDYGGDRQAEELKDVIAWAITASGLILRGVVIGLAYIKRGGLKKKVYAENLVTSGMFGVTRNPLYVGNILMYAGFFLAHGNPVVAVIGMVWFLFAYQCIVRAEENFLRAKFGPAYDAYSADVPRWGFRFSRFKESTEGMSFNFLKVILNDYTTIANAVIILTLTEAYEAYADPLVADKAPALQQAGIVIGVTVLIVGLIAAYKKRATLFGGKRAT